MTAFFAYAPDVRTLIYTTITSGSLHMRPRKIIKNRGQLPSNDGATMLLFLALRNIEKDWEPPQRTWKQAANQFAIMFGERFTNATHETALAQRNPGGFWFSNLRYAPAICGHSCYPGDFPPRMRVYDTFLYVKPPVAAASAAHALPASSSG